MPSLGQRLARGDHAAFTELYDRCADQLVAYAALRMGSRDEGADVVQAAFWRAVKNRRRFRSVQNPVAYLFQMLRNETLRAQTARRRTRTQSIADPNAVNGEHRSSPDHDTEEMINGALARLTLEDREIIELKLYTGLTFEEIADILQRPASSVATRYRRALDSLRGWLHKQVSQE